MRETQVRERAADELGRLPAEHARDGGRGVQECTLKGKSVSVGFNYFGKGRRKEGSQRKRSGKIGRLGWVLDGRMGEKNPGEAISRSKCNKKQGR